MTRKKYLKKLFLFLGLATITPIHSINPTLEKAAALAGGFAFGATGLWIAPPILASTIMYITDKTRRQRIMKPFFCGMGSGMLTLTAVAAKAGYDYLKAA